MSDTYPKPLDVQCRECGAFRGIACTTTAGKPARPHAARKKASGPEQPSVAEQAARPTYQPGQSAQYKPTVSTREARCAVATEDGHRLLRNATYGIADDTLDPLDVVRALLEYPEEVYTTEQWDERQTEHDTEIADEKKATKDAEKERDEANQRREVAEGKLEQAEVDLQEARQALELATADAARWRSKASDLEHEKQRALSAASGVPSANPAEGESPHA